MHLAVNCSSKSNEAFSFPSMILFYIGTSRGGPNTKINALGNLEQFFLTRFSKKRWSHEKFDCKTFY